MISQAQTNVRMKNIETRKTNNKKESIQPKTQVRKRIKEITNMGSQDTRDWLSIVKSLVGIIALSKGLI